MKRLPRLFRVGSRATQPATLYALPVVSTHRSFSSSPRKQSEQRQRRNAPRTHRPQVSATPSANTAPAKGEPSALFLTENDLDALLSLSLALYEDEALAGPSSAPSSSSSVRFALTDSDPLQLEQHMSNANPDLSSRSTSAATEGVMSFSEVAKMDAARPEDAFGNVHPDDLMSAMFMAEDFVPTVKGGETELMQQEHKLQKDADPRSTKQLQRNEDVGSALGPAHTSGGAVETLAATLQSDKVPLEQKMMVLLDALSKVPSTDTVKSLQAAHRRKSRQNESFMAPLFSDQHSTAVTTKPLAAVASALLLPGLDMKAVLTHGELAGKHFRHLSLTRCDFSHVRWSDMIVEDCDVSRCIFYQAEWRDVVFRRCNFAGALMKAVQCGGRVRFEDCSFRLAAVGLVHNAEKNNSDRSRRADYDENGRWGSEDDDDDEESCGASARGSRQRWQEGHSSKSSGVRFVRCDFDLSDFQFSSGLNNAAFFTQCSNTHLASRFPLRARGGVN